MLQGLQEAYHRMNLLAKERKDVRWAANYLSELN